MSMPSTKPRTPNFSSGPCAKRPGYDVAQLDLRALGRSHRSALGKKLLGACCTETARILGLPEGYRVAVVPASDTGAVEMAMWSLLGPRGAALAVAITSAPSVRSSSQRTPTGPASCHGVHRW